MSSSRIAGLRSQLQLLFQRSPALALLFSGAEHTVEYANPACEAALGRRDLIGHTVASVAPGLVEQGFGTRLGEIYETREPWVGSGVPTRLQLGDGSVQTFFFDFVYQPLLDEAGEPFAIFGQGIDVTARVHAERALKQSQTTLELATRASSLGVWDWRLDKNEIIFSDRAKAIWGLSPSAVVTLDALADLIHPDDVAATNERFARAINPWIRDTSAYEYRVRLAKGGQRWVRAHAEAVFQDSAKGPVAVRYVGTMEDVTGARQAEAALRHSEARLRLALEAGRMAVWAVDAEGNVEAAPEFNRLLNLPPDARPSLAELQARYYPGELERLQKLAEETLSRGERYLEFEYRHLWPDDQVRWFLVRAELLVSAEGTPAGAIGVIMDITERHESEDRLKLLAGELDHRANNLLAVIQGAVSLTTAETAQEFKELVLGRIFALARSHQLLASSRWASADLRKLVEEEVLPYEHRGRGRFDVNGEPAALEPAVAQGLAMAIHELATNAVKYGALSTDGGRVCVEWRPAPNGMIEIKWTELGGPAVSAPKRRGFGSRVLERSLSGTVGGRTEVEWRVEGLVCRLFVPAQAAIFG